MKLVFVSVPSRGVFEQRQPGHWDVETRLYEILAELHDEQPDAVFICPSMQNYSILPFMKPSPRRGPTYASWDDRCRKLIAVSDEIVVLQAPFWSKSVGVTDEIKTALDMGVPVVYRKW